MSHKYQSLSLFLRAVPENTMECTLGFSEIEELIGQSLPASALNYRAWWANQSRLDNRPQVKAWESAGFSVDAVQQGEGGWVRFKRATAAETPRAATSLRTQTRVLAPSSGPTSQPGSQRPVRYEQGTVALISCVATKRPGKNAARDLYTSAWFSKARQHVEGAGLTWGILSAKHGLLSPGQEIDSYEMTLNNMSARERKAWAESVVRQIRDQFPGKSRFVMFAGSRYRQFLQPLLESEGATVLVPMAGLTQGRQLNWFDTHPANVQA